MENQLATLNQLVSQLHLDLEASQNELAASKQEVEHSKASMEKLETANSVLQNDVNLYK